jgi:hypothetical protein
MVYLWWAWMACAPAPTPGVDDTDDTDDTDGAQLWPRVVINELMAAPVEAWFDPDAPGCPEADDWVELYNADAAPVDLSGWRLVEGSDALALSGVLEPGAWLLITADGEPAQGPMHAPFRLSADGESLRLLRPDGSQADAVSWRVQAEDRAWGRDGDGAAAWATLPEPSPGTANHPRPSDPCLVPDPLFDDHTVRCLPSLDAFLDLAGRRAGARTVKFDILGFSDPASRRVVFPDGNFYTLHDEWYLFRMLNGQPVQGEDLYEPYPGSFADIPAMYDWARGVDLDATLGEGFARWAGLRLTSPRFYELALSTTPRPIGVGVLTWYPARTEPEVREELWGFELEFSDDITYEQLVVYFEALAPVVPPGAGDRLRWLVRSQAQERVAEDMEAGLLPYHDRILRYADLTIPGEVEVYHPGVTAGRVKLLQAGEEIATGPDDLVVLAELPDELPPGVGLVTGVPQTPLSHVSLLAESRGIPNVYVAGVTADPQWDQWGRVRAWVGLLATADGALTARSLTSPEIAQWRRLQTPVVPVLPPVDTSGLPWALPLTGLGLAQMPSLRGGLGGKSAGLISLLTAPDVVTPDAPVAVTIRAGQAHAEAVGRVDEVLAIPNFQASGNGKQRLLVLEGQAVYEARYGADAVLSSALTTWPSGDPIGELVRGRGLRGAFEDTPAPADVLASIEQTLREAYAHLAPSQGLRFRSSSNVEDAEGFNGAGLYGSYTGWLTPPASDPDATVGRALQSVWGSYWGAEAFEERLLAGFDHRSGAMGALVHPRFDDAAEEANAVITVTRLPDGRFDLVANAQLGSISVTNPPPADDCRDILPEVARVDEGGVTRVVASSEVSPGQEVLSDAELIGLYDALSGVVTAWLDTENAALPAAWRRSTLTLDFEARRMADGWPALASGETRPGALVVKQARALEPSLARVPAVAAAVPAPRDLLARAREVARVVCPGDEVTIVVEEVRSDPLLRPDMGFSAAPFVASVALIVEGEVAALGWQLGDGWDVDHLGLTASAAAASTWSVQFGPGSALADGTLAWEDGQSWSYTSPDGTASGAMGACVREVLWSSPEAWLEGLLVGP